MRLNPAKCNVREVKLQGTRRELVVKVIGCTSYMMSRELVAKEMGCQGNLLSREAIEFGCQGNELPRKLVI